MAANAKSSDATEQHAQSQQPPDVPTYFDQTDPKLDATAVEIFTNYSNIPPSEQIPHILAVRKKAWSLFPYPCIGQYSFLEFAISSHPSYSSILSDLLQCPSKPKLLDLGCCVGQDLRKLIHDGVDPYQLVGSDLHAAFFDLGFDLFRDREHIGDQLRFLAGDFFNANFIDELRETVKGKLRYIYAGSFFHLFNWDEQVETVTTAVRLLQTGDDDATKEKKIFGRQTGAEDECLKSHHSARSGQLFRHNEASWTRLVQQVARETGTTLEAGWKLQRWTHSVGNKEDRYAYVYFEVTMQS